MRCKQVKDLLVPFLEGELSPAADLMVASHLAKCTKCESLGHQLESLEIPIPIEPTVAQTLQMHAALENALNGVTPVTNNPTPSISGRWYASMLPMAVGFMVLLGLSFWKEAPNMSQNETTQPASAGVIVPAKHWF